ncbi:MAG: DJ-1/PfpI family protein [Candidatus Micrarchaeota archaeon]
MANILLIVAPVDFRDEEALVPKKIFEENGHNVKVASKGTGEAKGKLGASLKVDADIGNVNADEFDAIVFAGGPGAKIYFNDAKALGIARDAAAKGKVVAAICIAPRILANAGILEGKKATTWDPGDGSESRKLEEKGAKYTGNDVEIDGKIITANGPAAAEKFANKIIELL